MSEQGPLISAVHLPPATAVSFQDPRVDAAPVWSPQVALLVSVASGLTMYGLLAVWFLEPWLADKPFHEQLFWLTIPHIFRYVGLAFIVPGVGSNDPASPLPTAWATAAAALDFLTAILAMLAAIAIRATAYEAPGSWRYVAVTVLVWVYNIIGLGDLLNNFFGPEKGWKNIPSRLGSAWFIVTVYVPALIVLHVVSFVHLFGALA
uniref:Uncharacterized protein n=1 Tax=Zooxanthella nutricula TaxID=1333877 RepID=A0A6V0FBT1_9DINO|mmetsp:Transcript_72451/g.221843  ORF Transcript_72451/g.221843 Transcript_72451/m.221843 type:complete len:206 (+) Transcript_72451:101-718(+)